MLFILGVIFPELICLILKVRGGKFKGDVRDKFFTQRVVGVWNMLPGVVVEADTIGVFMELLDKHMNMQGIEEYEPRAGRRN